MFSNFGTVRIVKHTYTQLIDTTEFVSRPWELFHNSFLKLNSYSEIPSSLWLRTPRLLARALPDLRPDAGLLLAYTGLRRLPDPVNSTTIGPPSFTSSKSESSESIVGVVSYCENLKKKMGRLKYCPNFTVIAVIFLNIDQCSFTIH